MKKFSLITKTKMGNFDSLFPVREIFRGQHPFTSWNYDARAHHIRQPFQREPDFGVTGVNYNFAKRLA